MTLDPKLLFAVQVVLNTLTWIFIARVLVWPRLVGRPWRVAVAPLVLFHCVRTLGLCAAMPGVVGPATAATEWARHVAIGDAITVVLALVASVALRSRLPDRAVLALVWLMNVVGFLDVLNAARNSVRDRILDLGLGPQVFVIAFGVPGLVVTHITIFILLLRRNQAR